MKLRKKADLLAEHGGIAEIVRQTIALDPEGRGVARRTVYAFLNGEGDSLRCAALIVAACGGDVEFEELISPALARAVRRGLARGRRRAQSS